MPQPHPNRVLLIAGPTASGKSALALRIAHDENGVIINADSMQVYRELRVLTARPSADDEALVSHRLYGHVPGAEDYSVARWQGDAMAEINAAHSQSKLPILCGGTGLYFMALLQGLAALPAIDAGVREKWRGYESSLHDALRARDPEMAAMLHPSDRQRLIRALEVIESTGQSLRTWQLQASDAAPLRQFEVQCWFKTAPRDALYARSALRFEAMLEQGALEEIRALPDLSPQQPLMKAIGVRELLAHVKGEMSLDDARRAVQTQTRNYIKRQLTWARSKMADWDIVQEGPAD